MPLVIEDGSGVPTANSYVTVDEFKAFHVDRGNTLLAEADEDQIEAALVKGSDYLQQKFRLLWNGSRATTEQRLDWPRRGVAVPDFFDPFFRDLSNVPISFQDTLFIAEDEVLYEAKVAQMLVAAETFDAAGNSSGQIQPSLGRVTKVEQLGTLKVEYFGEGGTSRQTTKYWNVEQTVEPFLSLSSLFGGQLIRN